MLLLTLLLACSEPTPPPAAPVQAPSPEPTAAAAPLVAPQADGPPTVVVVSLDTTRADAVGAWGSTRQPLPRTPTLDALAARGTRFSWALASAPTTLASHTSLWSARDVRSHGVYANGQDLPTDLPLLPEQLAAAGYDTVAAVGAMVLSSQTGIDRGFRVYDDGPPGTVYRLAPAVTDAALAAADQRDPTRPLLLFAHYYDAHTPWRQVDPALLAPFVDPAYFGPIDGGERSIKLLSEATRTGRLDPADARQALALYRAQVAAIDGEVARLLAGLEERGLMQRAVVVVLGDHGETLEEHATTTPWSHGPDVDLVATHVPLVLAGEGLPTGLVVDRPVRLLDVAPTLLASLGLPPLPGAQGEDLGPLLRGEAPVAPPALLLASQPSGVTRTERGMQPVLEQGIAHEGHLLVRGATRDGLADRLYALAEDQPPVEDPALAAHLGAQLDAWVAAHPTGRLPVVDPTTQQQLEQLGYVEGGTAPAGRRLPPGPPPVPAPPR